MEHQEKEYTLWVDTGLTVNAKNEDEAIKLAAQEFINLLRLGDAEFVIEENEFIDLLNGNNLED